MRAIAQNAGFEGSVVVEKVKSLPEGRGGLNCANGEYGKHDRDGRERPGEGDPHGAAVRGLVAALILIHRGHHQRDPQEGPDLSALAAAGMQGGGGMY